MRTTATACGTALIIMAIAGIGGCGLVPGGNTRSSGTDTSLPELALPGAERLEQALQAPMPEPIPPANSTRQAPSILRPSESVEPKPVPIPPANSTPKAPSILRPYESVEPKPVPIPSSPAAPNPAGGAVAAVKPPAEPTAAPQEKKAAKPKKERTEKKSVPVQQIRISQKALSLGQLRMKYSNYFKVAGSPSENKIALTFDDGPDGKYTAQVLDVLKKNNVKATFFVVGFRAKEHPELIARMVREGHIVGNHSYNHAILPKLSTPNFEKQIESTQSVLRSMLGYEPRLFRPPYGAVNEEQVRWAGDHQFLIVNWNVDSLDWKGLSAEKVSGNILSAARSGSIILQHCGGGNGQDLSGTVIALPGIIQKLRSQGYQFVTVPELLHVTKDK